MYIGANSSLYMCVCREALLVSNSGINEITEMPTCWDHLPDLLSVAKQQSLSHCWYKRSKHKQITVKRIKNMLMIA